VRPGRDMGTILAIAARNELLRKAGTNSPLEFMDRLEQELVTGAAVEDAGPATSGAPPGLSSSAMALESSAYAAAAAAAASSAASPRAPAPLPANSPLRRTMPSLENTGRSSNESSAWIPAVRPKRDE